MGQEHVARQNRRRLLNQIRMMWIEGVLEHSLHQAALKALDVQEQPDTLAHPWHLERQETDQSPHPFAPGTSIVQVYDQAQSSFLILGEPGSGKTTLLLELARTLVERAEADEHQSLPVVFHLSSWAQKRTLLSDWLVEELRATYQVPRALGKAWIAANQILPLLDGLDEVAEEARPGCVQAINAYAQRQREQGAAPLVVCCRSQDYAALPTRVNPRQAVNIQPLTEDQIEEYLQSTKGQLEGLRQVLHQDPELSELAQRPLMLSIITLAYQGAGPGELPTTGTREAQQQQIFASYVERMLRGRGISKHASGEHMLWWLRRLSTQMQRHHQAVFFLEQLQPDWLTDQQRDLLYWLSIGLFVGLVGGLVGGLFVGLVGGLLVGLFIGLFVGLFVMLFVGLAIRQLDEEERLHLRPNPGIWRSTLIGLVGGLGLGLVFGLRYGLVVGLVIGLGVLLTHVAWQIFLWRAGSLPWNLVSFLDPNPGIWRSTRNGLFVGLWAGLGEWLFAGLWAGLSMALFIGLVVGLIAVLRAFLPHVASRIFLWRAGFLPWNLVAFLDEAAERHLLHKVGGGYIFMHRLLLDYFASLEKKES
jgi:DNA polymerase III delta prime subunit